jgi:hypothetical protein
MTELDIAVATDTIGQTGSDSISVILPEKSSSSINSTWLISK